MTSNAALAELESNADVGEAKRDLVLRFVRDQESLQTSQVQLKLVDDDTIDLIDSTFTINDNQDKLSEKSRHTDPSLRDRVTGLRNLQDGRVLVPRPPLGRPLSRKSQRKGSYEPRDDRKDPRMRSSSDTRPMSPTPYRNTQHYSLETLNSSPLNSSWPAQQQFLPRKLTSRKYTLCSPESCADNSGDGRPLTTREVIAARVRKHSASDRVSCNIGQLTVDSPLNRQRQSKSRGRTFMNLNLEPVHPGEIPLLRGASASSTGPYTLVQLPPIKSRDTPATTPPFS